MVYFMNEDIEKIIKENVKIHCVKNGKHKRYVNIAASFDIETTSFYYQDRKCALMYIWQFGIYLEDKNEVLVILGRTWSEFYILLTIIKSITPEDYYFPIYVHNLSFEYSFLKNEFKGMFDEEGTFFLRENTPLYSRMMGSIEFRCSYALAGCKLADLDTPTRKLVGDLDYSLIRHNKTEITEKELQYCINDVVVLCEYIHGRMVNEEGLNMSNIPYTKTGFVREGLNRWCCGSKEDGYFNSKKSLHTSITQHLQLKNPLHYLVLKAAFQGGFTGANPDYVNSIIEGVSCVDFSSSYPSQICEGGFPIRFLNYYETLSEEQYNELVKLDRACVFKIRLHHVKAKYHWSTSISYWKCEEVEAPNFNLNNGKLYQADYVDLYMTSIDYWNTQQNYDFDNPEFSDVYTYEKGYLPKSVVTYILKLYGDKTTLKNKEGFEVAYALGKSNLNSVYGMMVTDICKSLIYEDDNGECHKEELNGATLAEKVDDYNKKLAKGKITTAYEWGVWIAAYSRMKLWMGIRAANFEDVNLFVYSDTDSIYYISNKLLYPKEVAKYEEWLQKYNDWIKMKMEKMLKHYDLPLDSWCPETIDHKKKPLGYWDADGDSKLFKTCGAKRYLKVDNNNHLKITVAGLGKQAGAKYLAKTYDENSEIKVKDNGVTVITLSDEGCMNVFEHFDEGLEIPKDKTGKMTHTFINERIQGELEDFNGVVCRFDALGGTHLENCSFSMSFEENFIKFLCDIRNEYEIGL